MSDDDKFTVYCICLYIKDKQSNFLPLLVNTVVVITEVWHAANDKVCMETYWYKSKNLRRSNEMHWNWQKISDFTEFHGSAHWNRASFTECAMAVKLWFRLVPNHNCRDSVCPSVHQCTLSKQLHNQSKSATTGHWGPIFETEWSRGSNCISVPKVCGNRSNRRRDMAILVLVSLIWRYFDFSRWLMPLSWIFKIFKFLTVGRLKMAELQRRAKFGQNWSKHCRDMAIFPRWRPSAVLDFYVCVRATHEWHSIDGLYHFAKFGWNRCSSFHNMHVFRFHEFGLKTSIHAPKIGVLGDFTCLMGSSINETHILVRVCIFWAVVCKNPSAHLTLSYISPIRPEASCGRMCTKFGRDVEVTDVITYDKLFGNRLRYVNSVGGQKLPSPID